MDRADHLRRERSDDAVDPSLAQFHTPAGATRDLEPGAAAFSISDLCRAFEVTPRTLRFYEAQGLLTPRREGQRRIYGLRDRARLFLVLRGKRFGFSLAEIRELLDLYELGDRQRTQLEKTLNSCHSKLDLLRQRRRDLDEAIGELEEIIGNLEATAAEFEPDGGGPAAKRDKSPKKRILGGPFPDDP